MNKIFFHQRVTGKKVHSCISKTIHSVIKICVIFFYTISKLIATPIAGIYYCLCPHHESSKGSPQPIPDLRTNWI